MNTLTPAHERAADALADPEHRTLSEAAEAARVPERTLRRWRGDEDFAALVEAHRLDRRERLAAVADETTHQAIAGLRAIAENEELPAYVRRAAWADLLTWSQQIRDNEIEQQLSDLEADLKRQGWQ